MLITIKVCIITVVILCMPDANLDNLSPVLYNGIRPVLNGAFGCFAFPLAETVLFMTIFNISKERNNPIKIYYYALTIGSFFVFIVTLRNILVLGPDLIDQSNFPSFAAVSLINIGNFLQRIEVTVAVVLLLGGFVKISVCLFAASKGVDYLFKIGNCGRIVAPVGLLMMVTSCFIYQSIMEMQEWAFKVYKYYAFPFQVILPVIIWIAAEISVKRQRNNFAQYHCK